MKKNIHPEYGALQVTCSCGNNFVTGSALAKTRNEYHVDVCSKCHPFYTGKQKIIDTSGRVDNFMRKYGTKRGSVTTSENTATLASQA